MLSTKGIVFLISISRPPPLFLWRSSRTAAHPGVLSGLVLLVSLVSWIAAMLTLFLWRDVTCLVILPLIPLGGRGNYSWCMCAVNNGYDWFGGGRDGGGG